MNNLLLENIINRNIRQVLLEKKSGSLSAREIIALAIDNLKNDKSSKDDKKSSTKSKKDGSTDSKSKTKKKIKLRKEVGGRTSAYDYEDYLLSNPKETESETVDLINSIDVDYVDVAAVARDIFPDHTDEGAQSQLRKILNRERPLTQEVARKIRRMIAAGKIPTK